MKPTNGGPAPPGRTPSPAPDSGPVGWLGARLRAHAGWRQAIGRAVRRLGRRTRLPDVLIAGPTPAPGGRRT